MSSESPSEMPMISSEMPMMFSESSSISPSMFPPKCNFILLENNKPHYHHDPAKIEQYKKVFSGPPNNLLIIFITTGVILSALSLFRIYGSFTKKQQVKPPVPAPVPEPSMFVKILLSAYTHLVIGIIMIATCSAKLDERNKFYNQFKKEIVSNCIP